MVFFFFRFPWSKVSKTKLRLLSKTGVDHMACYYSKNANLTAFIQERNVLQETCVMMVVCCYHTSTLKTVQLFIVKWQKNPQKKVAYLKALLFQGMHKQSMMPCWKNKLKYWNTPPLCPKNVMQKNCVFSYTLLHIYSYFLLNRYMF